MTTTPDAEVPPVAAVARDVLRLGVGGRLPTMTEYQQRLDIGSGTIQKALRELRSAGAVDVVSRGHQGTFVTDLSLAMLWRFSVLPPVHVLMPPPGPVEAHCVAHALAEQLDEIGATSTVGFVSGARTRQEALGAGAADVAMMSSGAAGALREQGKIDVALGPGTYYKQGSLVVVTRAGSEPIRRVGVDPHSDDHRRLTRAEFNDDRHAFVETAFTSVPRAVLEGTIDAGVWHAVESLIPLELAGLATAPLSSPDAVELAQRISGAVLVAQADSAIGTVLRNVDLPALRDAWSRALEAGLPEVQARMRVLTTPPQA